MEEDRLLHFVKNTLETHGAIVYRSAEDLLETLIPENLAQRMGVREDQQFGFGPAHQLDPGVDYVSYNSEPLEKFSVLIEPAGFFTAVSAADLYLKQKGMEQLVRNKVSFLNSTHRRGQKREVLCSYLMFNFKYTALSEEKQEGIIPVTINEHTLAPLPGLKGIDPAIEEDLKAIPSPEEMPAGMLEPQPLDRVFQRAADIAKARIRHALGDFEKSLSRRMRRDIERITEYYQTITEQIGKRIQKRQLAGEEREREESRIRATQLELKKKVHDQQKRYSLKIQADLINALRIVIPVICMEYEVYRKKGKTELALIWNPLTKDLELPVCECCLSEAGGFFLCDGHMHLLCPKCYDACPSCRKEYCRLCHPRTCPRCSSFPTSNEIFIRP